MTQAQVVMVDGKDLPLHCPTNKTPAWNSHPRVFLDITKPGKRSARIAVLITNSFPALSHTGTKPYQRLTLRR